MGVEGSNMIGGVYKGSLTGEFIRGVIARTSGQMARGAIKT